MATEETKTSGSSGEHHHHHHHHHHNSKKDETGQYRKRMKRHVDRVRFIRKWSYIVVSTLAALVVMGVIFAYVIDR